MKTFDVSLKEAIPTQEIEAKNEEEAKRIYLEAVKRALNTRLIDAIEIDIVA